MYREITQGIEVVVEPRYVPEQSIPASNQFFYAYTVTISNLGTKTAELVSRQWVITDGNGQVHEVKGPGVVGETPKLRPGETFEYTSYCPLTTRTGNMRGVYMMKTEDGELFAARIPLFFLRDLRPSPQPEASLH